MLPSNTSNTLPTKRRHSSLLYVFYQKVFQLKIHIYIVIRLASSYTRMLRAILKKSWQQQHTRHQLYGHLPLITKTIQVRRTRHAGHSRKSRDELISDVLLWTPTYGREKEGRPARTYIQQQCEDTGCSPEDLPEAMNDKEKSYIYIYIYIYICMCVCVRGSGISLLAARHDDDDDDDDDVIHRERISLYHNSSVWLDTRDTPSREIEKESDPK